MELADGISDYIRDIATAFSSIEEVWLIGSRANNTFHSGSDWDFIVFADEATLKALKALPQCQKENVDLLIVYNGNDFVCPWGEAVNSKSGDLKTWEWQRMSESEVQYTAVKWVDDEEDSSKFCNGLNVLMGDMEIATKLAVKVWPIAMAPNTQVERSK